MTRSKAHWRLLAFAVALGALLLAAPAFAFAGTISGTVTVAGQVPTSTVEAVLWQYQFGEWMPVEADWGYAESGVDGAYSFTNVPNGTYRVGFVDYVKHWYGATETDTNWDSSWYYGNTGDVAVATNVVISAGVPTVSGANADMPLLPLSASGRVTAASGGAGIGDVLVDWYYQDSGDWIWGNWSTTTDANGDYQLRGLATAYYGTTFRIGATDLSGRYNDVYYTTPQSTPNPAAVTISSQSAAAGPFNMAMTRNPVKRLAMGSRYTSALQVAYEQFLNGTDYDFTDVTNIIVASGEDKAAADPLAAGGLCWANQVTNPTSPNFGKNAPMIIIPGTGTIDTTIKDFVDEVAAMNGNIVGGKHTVNLIVVGGPMSVPDAQINSIKSYVAQVSGGADQATSQRLLSKGGRYDMAMKIAETIKESADASATDSLEPPSVALVANGADSTKFFDALALSPISAANGYPILLVSATSVPTQTTGALAALGNPDVYVAGGSYTVSNNVITQLGANPSVYPAGDRLAYLGRYETAIFIANTALTEGWLQATGMGVAAKLPDALTGGAMVGDNGWPLLITEAQKLTTATSSWMTAHKSTIQQAYLFGGELSVSPVVETSMRNVLMAP